MLHTLGILLLAHDVSVTSSLLQTPTLRKPPRTPQATMAANTERDAFGRLPEELRIKIMKPYIGGMSTYGTPVL
jgi:hypothetical protein